MDPSRSGSTIPEGIPKEERDVLEILEIASAVPEPVEPVPVRVGAGAAVEVEPDIIEMKSAAEEHQRQCHKGARKGGGFYSCLCICIGQNI